MVVLTKQIFIQLTFADSGKINHVKKRSRRKTDSNFIFFQAAKLHMRI